MQTSEQVNEIFTAMAKAQGRRHEEAALIIQAADAVMPRPIRNGRRRPGESLAQRFYEQIIYGLSDCWYWRKVRPLGYGSCFLLGEVFAHRVSWRLHHGDIPEGMHVLHRCDVRNCVNPDHLFLGTKKDNRRDMIAKGRQPRGFKKPNCKQKGELHPASKLSAADISDIKDALTKGESGAAIARRYGVTRGNIYHIAKGRSWKE